MLARLVQSVFSKEPDMKELAFLHAALDVVNVGVVLLDEELRATYINRAFRKMWNLPDAKADSRPPFIALLYHGRDTSAYELSGSTLDAYVAHRMAQLKANDPEPLDIRMNNGEVVRYQCTALKKGRRMITYTYVTDIVRHADELVMFQSALDNAKEGILILDGNLRALFMNRSLRQLWNLSDELAASNPKYAELIADARFGGTYSAAAGKSAQFIAGRVEWARRGDATPVDIPLESGRIIRAQCSTLPNNARMLTYSDVTDLVRHAEQLELLATTDSLTEVFNRRHFFELAAIEWDRFQRYHRPVSALMLDIDHFKLVNDTHGHEAGDRAICQLARICEQVKRQSDILGRLGGEEFAILLPETDREQAMLAAERVRRAVDETPIRLSDEISVRITVSVGVAQATASMPNFGALIKRADEALYRAKAGGRNRVAQAEENTSELALAAE